MKAGIHPIWYPKAKVTCVCGNNFTVGSTKEEIRADICHKCHPFFTGQLKYVDTAGQVERFQKKQQVASARAADLTAKKAKKAKQAREVEEGPKTLKEMLLGQS